MTGVVKAMFRQARILTHTFHGNLTSVTRGLKFYIDILNEEPQLSPCSMATNTGLYITTRWLLGMDPGIFNIEEVITNRTDQQRLEVSEDNHVALYRSHGAGHVLSSSESMYFVRAV